MPNEIDPTQVGPGSQIRLHDWVEVDFMVLAIDDDGLMFLREMVPHQNGAWVKLDPRDLLEHSETWELRRLVELNPPCRVCHGQVMDAVQAGSCGGGPDACGGCISCLGPCPNCGTSGVEPHASLSDAPPSLQ